MAESDFVAPIDALSRESAPEEGRADSPARSDPMREDLHRFAEVAAREFNDAAPFGATLSRLVNLYRRSGLGTAEFADHFDAARQRTKERTGAIRLPAAKGTGGTFAGKNKMPYFFALLEDLLGLRSAPDNPVPAASEVPATPADDCLLAGPAPQHRLPIAPSPDRSQVGRSPSTRAPKPAAPAADADDARLIGEVVQEFSRQFASYEAAVALGDWAVARWRGSGLSRGRFLEVAQVAADGLLRDHVVAASAPGFRARLEAALAEPGDRRESTSPRDSSSPSAGQRAAPRGQGGEAARLPLAAGRAG